MRNVSKQEPRYKLKKSLESAKNSFDGFSEETISKWKIGRRNFP